MRFITYLAFCASMTSVAVHAVQPADVVPDALEAKARARGTIRVIVTLDVVFRPEGTLASVAAVKDQRQNIAAAQNAVISALASQPYEVIWRYQTLPYLAIETGSASLRALESLAFRGLVTSVVEDRLYAPTLAESAPLVGANTSWNTGSDGAGTVIAILDTGVDKNHPFLAGKVVEELCVSSGRNCPNGDSLQRGAGAGMPCTFAPNDCRHGTHVAGIAAGNGGTAFSGVAKSASLMAVQVFSANNDCREHEENPCARVRAGDLIRALEEVFLLRGSYNFAAVNMSLGGGQHFSNCDGEREKGAIDNLRSFGIATVVSSGNNGYTNALKSPACISSAISVGSTDDGSQFTTVDRVSEFSNSASFLTLLAPGRWIESSVPGGLYDSFPGTSMAAPHVAGAWAVLKQAEPGASVDKILTALRAKGIPVKDYRNGIIKPRLVLPIPGVLQFSASTYSVNEGGDYAVITVTRTGGGDGEVSVFYGTQRRTANYPDDYRVAAGKLTWANGDTSVRTVNIRIVDDEQIEGSETLDVILGNPGGGAKLGPIPTAVLTIEDNDVACDGLRATIVGTPGDDIYAGTPNADIFQGLQGNDAFGGLGGDDTICGGAGNDMLNGGPGNDKLLGARGDDRLNGGSGTDSCDGGPGRDKAAACEARRNVP